MTSTARKGCVNDERDQHVRVLAMATAVCSCARVRACAMHAHYTTHNSEQLCTHLERAKTSSSNPARSAGVSTWGKKKIKYTMHVCTCIWQVCTYVHVSCVCMFVCICMSCALIYLWVGILLQVFSKLPPVCQLVVHPVEPSLVDIDFYPSPILGPGHTLWGRHGIVYHVMLKPITEVDSIELCIYPN